MAVKVRERPKGSGTWWLFIDHKGKRKAKKVGDKKTALAAAEKIQARLVLGQWNPDEETKPVPTFGEYAKTWRDVVIPATCKRSTVRTYRATLKKYVLPAFGKRSVNEIKKADIKAFLMDWANRGCSRSLVAKMRNILAGVLTLAVDAEVIPVNPAHRLGKIARLKQPKRIEPLTRDELSHLLATFRTYFPSGYALALTLARTGLRLGEALGLQWNDIDFHGRFIRVSRSITNRGEIETTKSDRVRMVDMSRQLTMTLKALHAQRKAEKLRQGWRDMPEWVFTNDRGGVLDQGNWRTRTFHRALEKAGLR